MKKSLAVLILMGSALRPAAAQEAKSSPYDVKYKHEKAIRAIRGVQDLSVGGINGDLQLIVRVDGAEARDNVRDLLGESFRGCKVAIRMSDSSSSAQPGETVAEMPRKPASSAGCTCVCPEHRKPAKTEAEQVVTPDQKNPNLECDMMRQLLGLPKRKNIKRGVICQQMIGWTNDPVKIQWVIKEGLPHAESQEWKLHGSEKGGVPCPEHGIHGQNTILSYSYIKHRQFCPYGWNCFMNDVSKMTPGK